jgi:uncharacterized membrane protein YbhN (UPF0104 family)
MKNKWVQVVLSLASLGLAVTLVVYLPQIVHALTGAQVSWSQIGAQFQRLSWSMVALMTALWLASLWAYTFVLTSSLPGLTHLQALTLNAAGSAVSNLLPFGGAAGVAMTFAMTRGWGFPVRSVVVSTLVTGVWNTLFRFILPAVGLIGLLAAGKVPNPVVAKATWVGVISILALVAVVAAALYWDRAALLLGRALDAVLRLLPARFRPAEHWVSDAIARLRAETAEVVRGRWLGLSLGMIAFLTFQCLIMAACLVATGAYTGPAETVAVFALSRVLTSAVVTPSGAGIMEGGTAALIIAFGEPASAATAAALLFGFWTYTIEIPAGGLALGAWSLLRRRDRQTPSAPVAFSAQSSSR